MKFGASQDVFSHFGAKAAFPMTSELRVAINAVLSFWFARRYGEGDGDLARSPF